jgi:hypothetical protein
VLVYPIVLFSIAPLFDFSSPFKTLISNLFGPLVARPAVDSADRTLRHQEPHWPVIHLLRLQCNFFRFRLPCLINTCLERYRGCIVRVIEQDLESTYSNSDVYTLRWAISSVQTDDELGSLIGAIPRFLDSERYNYLQYAIEQLLEDSDVRLGWSNRRLLKTFAYIRTQGTGRTCTRYAVTLPALHGISRRSLLIRNSLLGHTV